ncbi:MAG: hypothetical protein QNJ29_07945 [Rhizobiaceae bacterium]|nr:hypothetical protein [Rhizobiaceae bacterium]
MKNLRLLITSAFLCFVFSGSLANANKQVAIDTCELVDKLVSGGGEAGLVKISEMFSWDEDLAAKVPNALGALKNYEYTKGRAVIVADFEDISVQHFVAIATKNSGALYFRMTFESYRGELVLLNIDFNDDIKKIMQKSGPFLQNPVDIEC